MDHAYPFVILGIGILVVLGGIIALRVNAFLALLAAALVVSFLAGAPAGSAADPVARVAIAFGSTAGAIGIVIALAALVGEAMIRSGAADRLVRTALDILGEKRAATAMMASGFVMSIPVFFDTAFYLLVPLARSLYRATGRHYLRYLMAITAGGVATHALVPPTPGPLFVANALGVELGVMIALGIVVALPAAVAGLLYGVFLDRAMPVHPAGEAKGAPPAEGGAAPSAVVAEEAGRRLPGILLSLLPIVLPIVLIAGDAVARAVAHADLIAADAATRTLRGPELTTAILRAAEGGSASAGLARWTGVLGNPNLALLGSAVIALLTLWKYRRPTSEPIPQVIEQGLMSAGVIILITSAGGAFGAMLREAGLGEAIRAVAESHWTGQASVTTGVPLLVLAFGVAGLIRFAQGSTTTSMIVTSGMVMAMIDPAKVGVHLAYVAQAIGAGALVASWMNDSGFWIFARMGGLTETETLRSWTPLLTIVGVVAFSATVVLAVLFPMAG
jgi:GntP family gluconate:H+ symporter